MSAEIETGDYAMVRHFIRDRGDITRWSEWGEKYGAFKERHPELIDALDRVTSAERTLEAVLNNLPNDYEEE